MKIGDKGIFISYSDGVWGKHYGGKEGKIIKVTPFTFGGLEEYLEIGVEFEDGKVIIMGSDEFELYEVPMT